MQSDLEGIRRLHESDKRAMRDNDVEALIDLWTDDGVLFPPGSSPVYGKSEIAKRLRASIDPADPPEVISTEFDFTDTTVVGDWAFESGTYKSVWRDPGSDTVNTDAGNILRILRRQADGSWKCARAIWNQHAPPAE